MPRWGRGGKCERCGRRGGTRTLLAAMVLLAASLASWPRLSDGGRPTNVRIEPLAHGASANLHGKVAVGVHGRSISIAEDVPPGQPLARLAATDAGAQPGNI